MKDKIPISGVKPESMSAGAWNIQHEDRSVLARCQAQTNHLIGRTWKFSLRGIQVIG